MLVMKHFGALFDWTVGISSAVTGFCGRHIRYPCKHLVAVADHYCSGLFISWHRIHSRFVTIFLKSSLYCFLHITSLIFLTSSTTYTFLHRFLIKIVASIRISIKSFTIILPYFLFLHLVPPYFLWKWLSAFRLLPSDTFLSFGVRFQDFRAIFLWFSDLTFSWFNFCRWRHIFLSLFLGIFSPLLRFWFLNFGQIFGNHTRFSFNRCLSAVIFFYWFWTMASCMAWLTSMLVDV